MKVPLIIKDKKDHIEIYSNKKKHKVNFPFKPFIFCQTDKFPIIDGQQHSLFKCPDHTMVDYTKLQFNTTDDQRSFVKDNYDENRYIYNNNYITQLYMSKPEFTLNYPNNNTPLTIMNWDIETRTNGDKIFSKPMTHPILSIGFSIWEYDNNGYAKKTAHHICEKFDKENNDDSQVIIEFLNFITLYDPDVYLGYNSELFDFPYIYTRCKLLKIDMTCIGRGTKEPWISPEGKIYIEGRIHYDVYKKVLKDQTLYGVKKFTLKVMARHFNVPLTSEQDIELKEAIGNTWKVLNEQPQLLHDYLDADIIRTEHVGNVYIRNDLMLAEESNIALNDTMNMYSSFIPKLMVGTEQYKLGHIGTESNFSKYNSLTGTYYQFRKYSGKNGGKKKELKFQGALVALYRHGFIPMVHKLDFKSMYPSCEATHNFGPDTTKIAAVRPYTGKFKFYKDNKYRWYNIPDANFNADIVLRVDYTIEGFLTKKIKMLWNQRTIIKKQMKEVIKNNDMDKYKMLNSQQTAIKVSLNCFHPDTEILTNNGIKLLKDINIGELVWSINPTTLLAELKEVTKKYEYNIDQEIYVSKHNRYGQMITEKHKMFYTENNIGKFESCDLFTNRHRVIIEQNKHIHKEEEYIFLTDFIDINNYNFVVQHTEDLRTLKQKYKHITFKKYGSYKKGSHIIGFNDINDIKDLQLNGYTILIRNKRSKKCCANPIYVNNKIFSRFIGFYLSEGSMKTSKEKEFKTTTRGISHVISIAQDDINMEYKLNMINTCETLLKNSVKSKIYINKKYMSFSSDLYNDIIVNHFGKKYDKHISNYALNILSLYELYNGMYIGDGNKKVTRYNISCKYKPLFDSYLQLLMKLDRTFRYRIDSNMYRIIDYEKRTVIKKSNWKKIKYNGKVYSLTVKDNHTVYAGIDGKMNWIGQSLYGFQGLSSSTYGDLGTAIGIVGMCRWTTGKTLIKYEPYLVNLDTDGVGTDTYIDEKETNKWLDQLMIDTFDIHENYMQMELEDAGSAFFCHMKNYVVLEDGKFTVHGSALKSAGAAKIVDRARDLALQHVFYGKPKEEVIREAYDHDDCTLEDYQMRIKLSKEIKEYADVTALVPFVVKQVKVCTNSEVQLKESIPYYITKNQISDPIFFPFYNKKTKGKNYTYEGYVNGVKDLDISYYEKKIDKILGLFDIERNEQVSFLPEFTKKTHKLDTVNRNID